MKEIVSSAAPLKTRIEEQNLWLITPTTKASIMGFVRSMSQQLVEKKIRVNAVAPGPIWTPFIVSSFNEDQVKEFGQNAPMGRAGQPSEVGPCFVFLACEDSSYITGQALHPNGGLAVNG